MNRLYQIKKTLRKNLDDNKNSKYNIEFILVNFNSDDGLTEYILNNFRDELKSEYLKFYYTDELIYWHSSIAKNTAHLLSNNKFIVNLDCDNFTGLNGGDWLLEKFKEYGDDVVLHQSKYIFGSGTMGRISMTMKNFLKIGGYDQVLKPMSHQDGDILERCKANGLKYISLKNENYNNAIKNTKTESLKNCYGKYDYIRMMKINMAISDFNIKSKEFIANNYFKNKKLGVLENIYRIKLDEKIKIK
tara:strand:- start:74 stop:811 length:738 start_codon:yes stop_codon:yes gene_type:complete